MKKHHLHCLRRISVVLTCYKIIHRIYYHGEIKHSDQCKPFTLFWHHSVYSMLQITHISESIKLQLAEPGLYQK